MKDEHGDHWTVISLNNRLGKADGLDRFFSWAQGAEHGIWVPWGGKEGPRGGIAQRVATVVYV
jgi:hypothetical protein